MGTSKRPYEQDAPGWRDKRLARRRLASRRTALAAALPAPEPDMRIDPLTGKPAQPARRSLRAMETSAPTGAGMSTSPLPNYEAKHENSGLGSRRVFLTLLALVLLTAIGACVFLAAGLPVLGHGLRLEWLVPAVAIIAVAIPAVMKRWSLAKGWQKLVISVSAIAVAVFFIAGIASNPVVIRGQVQAETSAKAQQARFAERVRDSLLELGDMDKYLKSSAADAWSRLDEIKAAQSRAEDISAEYTRLSDSGQLPAGEFGPVSQNTVAAAYAMSKALETRIKLLQAGDEKLTADLETQRTAFAQAWANAGTSLGEAVQKLGVPLTVESGPVES